MTETAETVGNTGPGTGRAPATNQENPVTTGATGATVWLTGLPSAGKTTIAHELAGRLRAEGHLVEVLDGHRAGAGEVHLAVDGLGGLGALGPGLGGLLGRGLAVTHGESVRFSR